RRPPSQTSPWASFRSCHRGSITAGAEKGGRGRTRNEAPRRSARGLPVVVCARLKLSARLRWLRTLRTSPRHDDGRPAALGSGYVTPSEAVGPTPRRASGSLSAWLGLVPQVL